MADQVRTCRVCGCTDDRACDGGCYWLDERDSLCSACAAAQSHVVSMTLEHKRRAVSLATCRCGWTSRTPYTGGRHQRQDRAVRNHWREVVALAGGTHV